MSTGSVCYKLAYTTINVPLGVGLNNTHNVLVRVSRSNNTVTVVPGTYTLTLTYRRTTGSPTYTFSKTYTVPAVSSYPWQTTVSVAVSIPATASGNYTITGATSVVFSNSATPVNGTPCP